jgi:hypothetical protein
VTIVFPESKTTKPPTYDTLPFVPIVFVAGNASDVFAPDLAHAIDAEVRKRFPQLPTSNADAYRSDPVEATGWPKLQESVMRAVPSAPHIAGLDAYQSVYLPLPFDRVEHILIPTVADPLEAGSLPKLLDELRLFALSVALPTDDVELMQLAVKYLEDEALFDADLDVQTFVQLLLTAKQATARSAALWIALE